MSESMWTQVATPHQGLATADIVTSTIAALDTDGVAGLSMHRLDKELGTVHDVVAVLSRQGQAGGIGG